MLPRSPPPAAAGAMVPGVGGVEPAVTLDQVPRWSDPDQRIFPAASASGEPSEAESGASEEPAALGFLSFSDPLTGDDAGGGGRGGASRFPVDQEINSRIYLWRGHPWNLEVDAVVNSTNESLDEAHSSPGLHAAAGTGLAEECATLGGCRTGMAKMTNAYDLPARKVIHTVGPKYAVKYHTAAENALSHCYRSCMELLIENGLESIAMGCIYTEAKNYPREPAAHVAIRTVRRFLEKQKGYVAGVVFCTTSSSDTEIYKRLLPLYFPRDKQEEEIAISKLPAHVGDENGETVIDERKIRIRPLPAGAIDRTVTSTPLDLPLSDPGSALKSYRGGVDIEGRPVMVVVGAHFLLRCLDLERFVLHVVKEFEPLIQKPYTIVYLHSAASLQPQPDLGFMKRLQQILGRKHQRNLHAIYILHPSLGLRTAVLAMQMFVDGEVWKKVVYVDRLVQLFKYIPREQLTMPDFVFQHDLEVNGGKGLIVDPRTKHIYQRASS
ncbi:hypothetical protein PVAP13_9KG216585 [Panicum virgatum]|uniref:Appr-1-p processing enzyme family protein n=1 Tax=Panicum virgatum TaxID=38727 RepID=A0A8T0NHT1_PANVG|nr:hypothetical protein PVAP13_9KG216585 [Panicum virgatum]